MKQKLQFHGTASQLRLIVAATGLSGHWEEILHGLRFRAETGAVMNWWSTTGTISTQGPLRAAAEFEQAVLAAARGESLCFKALPDGRR